MKIPHNGKAGSAPALTGKGPPSRYPPLVRLVNGAAAFLLCLCFVLIDSARGETRLLVLGDSLTAGFGLKVGDAFPARLEAALRREGLAVKVINGGVSGDTTAAALARLGWALGAKPDAVIIELGGNDALRGVAPARTEANLAAILARLARHNIAVLLCGMIAPPNMGRDYGRRFNAIYGRLAERFGVLFYPFFLEGVAMKPALNQRDGIHPNGRGVGVIVERLLPYARELVLQSR
jgi:acyl-CoA thioesterase-1